MLKANTPFIHILSSAYVAFKLIKWLAQNQVLSYSMHDNYNQWAKNMEVARFT